MERPCHPRNEIESVLGFAEINGWQVEVGCRRGWGVMYSPTCTGTVCYGCTGKITIWRSPAEPKRFADELRRQVVAWAMADAEASYPNMCRDHDGIHVYTSLPIGLSRKRVRRLDGATD